LTGDLTSAGLTLPDAFLHLGASAVVATDAPIQGVFALAFGDDLIDAMATTNDIAYALLETRQKYWHEGNPLGLLYAYYVNNSIARRETDLH
jgi:hypothetical protein